MAPIWKRKKKKESKYMVDITYNIIANPPNFFQCCRYMTYISSLLLLAGSTHITVYNNILWYILYDPYFCASNARVLIIVLSLLCLWCDFTIRFLYRWISHASICSFEIRDMKQRVWKERLILLVKFCDWYKTQLLWVHWNKNYN
jgi:hypothetical protein